MWQHATTLICIGGIKLAWCKLWSVVYKEGRTALEAARRNRHFCGTAFWAPVSTLAVAAA
jgi:hypothetical protein